MRKENEQYCNGCGRQISNGQGPARENVLEVEQTWGYFSKKDGEVHRFCLCESCYDRIRRGFALPVEVEQLQEYL